MVSYGVPRPCVCDLDRLGADFASVTRQAADRTIYPSVRQLVEGQQSCNVGPTSKNKIKRKSNIVEFFFRLT